MRGTGAAWAVRVVAISAVLWLSYRLTCPPFLSLVHGTDGGDLVNAAVFFGIAHPPGYGLYTLLSGLVIRLLPMVSAVHTMQLLSQITAVGLSLLVGCLSTGFIAEPRRRRQAFTAAALLCGWSQPVWDQALMIEVYLFEAVLLVCLLLLVQAAIRLRTAQHEPRYIACLIGHVFGLALTHHLTTLLWLPGVALLYRPRRWPQIVGLIVGGVSGLWPWLYLLLRGGHAPQANWGGLEQGPAALIAHITAQDYRVFLQPLSAEALMRGVIQWASALPAQITPFGGIVLLVGLLILRSHRGFVLAYGVWIGCVAGFTGLYRAPETQAAYTLPLIMPTILIMVCGVMRLSGLWPAWMREGVVWLLPLLLCVAFAPALDQRGDDSGTAFLAQVARLAPPHAVLLVERDGETFLLWAAQAEGWRPDITVVNGTLLNYTWYANALAVLAPDLAPEGRTQAERLRAVYQTSRPLIAPRLVRPPSGMRTLLLGEGWYCLTQKPTCP